MKNCNDCGVEMEYPHITRVRDVEFYWCREHCPECPPMRDLNREQRLLRAALVLAVEIDGAGCRSVEEYHGKCDANERIADHMWEAGLDPMDFPTTNRLTEMVNRFLQPFSDSTARSA